jgi:hypothetical protein
VDTVSSGIPIPRHWVFALDAMKKKERRDCPGQGVIRLPKMGMNMRRECVLRLTACLRHGTIPLRIDFSAEESSLMRYLQMVLRTTVVLAAVLLSSPPQPAKACWEADIVRVRCNVAPTFICVCLSDVSPGWQFCTSGSCPSVGNTDCQTSGGC